MSGRSLPVTLAVAAVLAVGLPALWVVTLGPLAMEMAVHIAVMSLAAPLAAIALQTVVTAAGTSRLLLIAALAQLLLLWALHVPGVHAAMMASPPLRAAILTALFVAATAFWFSLVSRRKTPPWQEILALLATAKLACLLAVLLVFAPRPLYVGTHHAAGLADQQMAGLLMLAACPLSYLVAAIAFATRLLGTDRREPRCPSAASASQPA